MKAFMHDDNVWLIDTGTPFTRKIVKSARGFSSEQVRIVNLLVFFLLGLTANG
jgi:hypothetical protein